jgi:hypothetical protein
MSRPGRQPVHSIMGSNVNLLRYLSILRPSSYYGHKCALRRAAHAFDVPGRV